MGDKHIVFEGEELIQFAWPIPTGTAFLRQSVAVEALSRKPSEA